MLHAFRIEHRTTRVGPFQTPGELTQSLAKQALEKPGLLSPFEDGLGLADIPWAFVFGCPSLDTMREWVLSGDRHQDKRVLKKLEAQGFLLMEYRVPAGDYRMGRSGKQLAFDAISGREERRAHCHPLNKLLS